MWGTLLRCLKSLTKMPKLRRRNKPNASFGSMLIHNQVECIEE